MDRSEVLKRTEEWESVLWSESGRLPQEWLEARGIGEDYARRYHLGYTGEDSHRFHSCISIPVLDSRGRNRAVRFRRIEGKPKYDQPHGERPHLFNVSSVKHYVVHLTEGEFDAILLEQLGIHAVGVPGASTFRDDWRWLFVGNDVRIIFDGDEAGDAAARKVSQVLSRVAERVTIVELPREQDVSSLWVENPDTLWETLEAYDA